MSRLSGDWRAGPVMGFRVLPCMDAQSVWVEVIVPMPTGGPTEMPPDRARDLAAQLVSAADQADEWRLLNAR